MPQLGPEKKEHRKTFLLSNSGNTIFNWLKRPLGVTTDIGVFNHALSTLAEIVAKLRQGAIIKFHFPNGTVEEFERTWVPDSPERQHEAIEAFLKTLSKRPR